MRTIVGVVVVLLCGAPSTASLAADAPAASAKPERAPAEPLSAPVDPDDIVGTGKKIYSQQDEELIVRDFFRDRRGGFYVDAGCAYARLYSTTYYLEDRLGWSGIGIDAVPSYEKNWKKHRPRGTFVNFLVTDRSGEEDTFYVSDYHPLSSIHARIAGPKHTRVKVPTITLNDLLERHGVKEVDFVSMDIEGAQLAALRGFDLKRYAPELLCVEMWLPDQIEIVAHFAKHGYERIMEYAPFDQVNWYFAPADHPRLAELAAREKARPAKPPAAAPAASDSTSPPASAAAPPTTAAAPPASAAAPPTTAAAPLASAAAPSAAPDRAP